MRFLTFFILLMAGAATLVLAVPRLARPLGWLFGAVPRAVTVVLATLLGTVLLLSLEPSGEIGWAIIAAAVSIFGWVWLRVFAGLMSQPDAAFPGRFDKLVWVALMVVLPPVGLAAFETYRLAYLAAPKAAEDELSRQFG